MLDEVVWARKFVGPISYPSSSVVIAACHDDHQKAKGFLPRHDYWDLIPHLMHSGSAVHIIAMWRALTGGINAPLV